MRAFWIIVLGLAGAGLFTQAASAKKSTISVHLTPKQVDAICDPFVHSPNIGTGEGGYGCSTASTDIRCTKDGECTITTTTKNAGDSKSRFTSAGTLVGASSLGSAAVALASGKARAVSTSNAFTGAAQGSIAVSPLKPAGSNAASAQKQVGASATTASTTMAVSPSKQAGPKAAAAASPNLGAAFMSSGRATLRPQ